MPKTVAQAFQLFLSTLHPTSGEHLKGISHRGSVTKCLENNWARTKLFETGSFGNGTGVRHFSDTDYFAICPEEAFYDNSATTLRYMKETLQRTFTQTVIEVRTSGVRISFGRHASEILEITPACYDRLVSTRDVKRRSYFIPDYEGGWMVSCPSAHNAYVEKQNKRLGGKLKPLIRLVKAWKFYNNVPITSFYLELRVTKYAEKRSAIVYDIDIRNIFKLLCEQELPRLQDPMGFSGYVWPCKTDPKWQSAYSKLTTGFSRAIHACQYRTSRPDVAIAYWQKFFNGDFPAY
ncbi:hypothetical protein KHS38_13000 [Mucilaginibacter sp. Bleaf8]|uniref:SMODS domain-containing nucleotidyltransferase n=1 Tax=Mucilaginibacter sp. Bleaf8 TaxID=2834430 RepID=UPI001BCAEF90|nr:hypothetical protein [Mucilaginibacter sp. Bleaf8]MBS7565324.1 hypothetical protein [Mucilaginibacter sp. Bleaf8]